MTPPTLARPLGVISKIRQCCALPHTYIYYVPKFQVPISNGVGGAILSPYPLRPQSHLLYGEDTAAVRPLN